MPGDAPYRYAKTLAFRPVAALSDADVLIEFGRGLYIESLGSDAQFRRDFGRYGQKFPLWIAASAASNRDFAALLTEDEAPIGMTVVGRDKSNTDVGHVHHLFVRRSHRGQGFGGLLDEHARDTLKRAGFDRARLNVAPGNERAIRFYQAQGWEALPHEGPSRGLRHMEVVL